MSTTLIILTILAVVLIAVLITYLICQRRQTTLQNRIVELQGVVQSRDEDRVEKEAMYNELKARALGMENENRDLRALKESQGKELELLHRQMEQERAERTKQLQDQLALVKEQLTTTTQEMLRQRTADLHQANAQQMGAIINPLKETIREMKSSMESSRDQNNKNTAALEEQIKQMLSSAQNIGAKADHLADALRNENKIQGNWGETILSELLQSQGLKEGIHYDVQAVLRDDRGTALLNEETGSKMIPDVVLHYPDGKDVVIDSKVSLTAFLEYMEADDETRKKEALGRHLNSMIQHVKELSKKNYSSYIKNGHQSLDYVIMFVPNESALQLALLNNTHLWRDAFDKGVFVTSEQNLIAALRMIQLAWTQELQHQNQERVYELANQLIDRVADFNERFEKLGDGLDALQRQYEEARKKLNTGRQSLLGPARQLVELGAKENPKRPLPPAEEGEANGEIEKLRD
ncbi:MAG: DNA recombination protein RmuC [Bacteroidaceae bacterium]|nr:DNA recombination protein RmuC [Bacteroidaceae bacterium]MBQ9884303.1 DNA recombination protein RmuC [Bacteroidaceae bacterium]